LGVLTSIWQPPKGKKNHNPVKTGPINNALFSCTIHPQLT
jgi:hypothetical protein